MFHPRLIRLTGANSVSVVATEHC